MPGRLDTGTVVSGAGHLGLIGWALISGWFNWSDPAPVVTNVTMVSGEEFAALLSDAPSPDGVLTPGPEVPEAPESPVEPEAPEAEAAPEAPAVEAPPQRPEAPARPATPAAPEEAPTETEAPPAPPVVEAPVAPAPTAPEEAPGAAQVLGTSPRPKERPAERIAPTPVAPPEEPTPAAPEAAEATQETEAPEEETPVEPQEEAAPEAAASEIVTEAEEEAGGEIVAPLAPTGSPRPRSRPARPARPEPQQTAAESSPAPSNESAESTSDAVSDALAEELAREAASQSSQSSQSAPARGGPPMTAGEKDALRVSVQQCWNVGSLSTDALRVTVTVHVSMNEDGTPDNGSIRMISSSGGSGGAVNQAFEAARRAIIRCGARGFPLPAEKYGEWAEIEMEFNPERMRIK